MPPKAESACRSSGICTQKAVCSTFASSVDSLMSGKTPRDFEVNYKPEEDEILCIENFLLPDAIKDAIRNPLGINSYKKDAAILEARDEEYFGFPEIKAIFVGERTQDEAGEHFNIAFQKYRREQNLATLPFLLFFSKDTFKQETNFGVGITNNIDCYYTGEKLQFT